LQISGNQLLLIWSSIGCALAMKIRGEAKSHEISKTQKCFGQILTGLGDIKVLMGINIKLS